MTEVLTREYGIANLVTPTGRSLGVAPWKVNPGLLQVVYTDSKPGSLPEELEGLFTKATVAETAIRAYVTRFWDESDKASKKK